MCLCVASLCSCVMTNVWGLTRSSDLVILQPLVWCSVCASVQVCACVCVCVFGEVRVRMPSAFHCRISRWLILLFTTFKTQGKALLLVLKNDFRPSHYCYWIDNINRFATHKCGKNLFKLPTIHKGQFVVPQSYCHIVVHIKIQKEDPITKDNVYIMCIKVTSKFKLAYNTDEKCWSDLDLSPSITTLPSCYCIRLA